MKSILIRVGSFALAMGLLVVAPMASASLILNSQVAPASIEVNAGDSFSVDVVLDWYQDDPNDSPVFLNTTMFDIDLGSSLTFDGATFNDALWGGFFDTNMLSVGGLVTDFMSPGVAEAPLTIATLAFTAGELTGLETISLVGSAAFSDASYGFAGLSDFAANIDVQVTAASVNEPSSVFLCGLFVILVLFFRKRHSKLKRNESDLTFG